MNSYCNNSENTCCRNAYKWILNLINSKVYSVCLSESKRTKQYCHHKVKVPVREIEIFGVNGLAPMILYRGNHMCESIQSSNCCQHLVSIWKHWIRSLRIWGLPWFLLIMYLDSRDWKTWGNLETLVKNRLPPRGNQSPINSFISKSIYNCFRSNLNSSINLVVCCIWR